MLTPYVKKLMSVGVRTLYYGSKKLKKKNMVLIFLIDSLPLQITTFETNVDDGIHTHTHTHTHKQIENFHRLR